MHPDARPYFGLPAADDDDPDKATIDRLNRVVGALVEGQSPEVIVHVIFALVFMAIPDLPTARHGLRRIAKLANAIADGLDGPTDA